MPEFPPKWIIDQLCGPPPTEGQKKLEDFKKKKIPKPEKPKTMETEIILKDREGRETTVNLEQIKQQWIDFYNSHNLKEMAEELKNLEITLTEEQTERIKELNQTENFNHFIVLPSVELQQKLLNQIKEQTEKEIPNLPETEQYAQEGTYLSNAVKPNFPKNIKTLNRPEQPYLLFTRDNKETDQYMDQSPDQIRPILKQKNLQSLTLQEYLLFQRNYTELNKKHPDHDKAAWLLDSELGPNAVSPSGLPAGKAGSGRVLYSFWYPVFHLVRVDSDASDAHYPSGGARSSAIFKIL